eukprot:6456961-Amphidinium_carterae.1
MTSTPNKGHDLNCNPFEFAMVLGRFKGTQKIIGASIYFGNNLGLHAATYTAITIKIKMITGRLKTL